MSVNKVFLLGRLGRDPELRFTEAGKACCKFPLATDSTWKSADGQTQKHVDWHNITVWDKQGENCAKFLTKGREVFVEGEVRYRSYEAKDGSKRFATEIVASRTTFIGDGRPKVAEGHPEDGVGIGADEVDDLDVPF